jgi:hypothetical protein
VYEGNFNKKYNYNPKQLKYCIKKNWKKTPTNPIGKRGEIMVKGAMGAKVKVLFQELHMPCVISVLVQKLKFCISNTLFNTTF